MPDFPYAISPDSIYMGTAHQTCRNAVLWPLVRRKGFATGKLTPATIAEAYAKLQTIWRARLPVLAANRWHAAMNADNYSGHKDTDRTHAGYRYVCLRNCPPFSARVGPPRGNPCTRVRICPMCYAREVVMELYKAMEWAFFLGVDAEQSPKPVLRDVRLIAVRRTWDVSLAERGAQGWIKRTAGFRFKELNLVPKKRGSIVLSTVEPGTKPGIIRIRRSTVMAVTSSTDLATLQHKNYPQQIVEPEKITRAAISKLTTWAFAYPVGLMFGDAAIAVELCNAAHEMRSRQFSTAGVFRNQTNRAVVHEPRADNACNVKVKVSHGN